MYDLLPSFFLFLVAFCSGLDIMLAIWLWCDRNMVKLKDVIMICPKCHRGKLVEVPFYKSGVLHTFTYCTNSKCRYAKLEKVTCRVVK